MSDHGIDMDIEFKDDAGKATGKKLHLVLKPGDSYNDVDVSYWKKQAFPVMLVARNSEGEVRWMEVREWLKRGKAFSGERWREKATTS